VNEIETGGGECGITTAKAQVREQEVKSSHRSFDGTFYLSASGSADADSHHSQQHSCKQQYVRT